MCVSPHLGADFVAIPFARPFRNAFGMASFASHFAMNRAGQRRVHLHGSAIFKTIFEKSKHIINIMLEFIPK